MTFATKPARFTVDQKLTMMRRPMVSGPRTMPFGSLTDAQLLKRFLTQRDQAAFELLVWRHGPMVLRVGVRVLHDIHRAEDVFQATFFTLATKAGSIGRQEAVSSWLYQVAYRLALRARADRAKQALRESPLMEGIAVQAGREPSDEVAWRDLGPVVDAEVQRLPEKLRAPFVLCYMQGKTNEEAAAELGCPKGTVLSRLSRARERLRNRLSRRGLTLSAGVLALLMGPDGWVAAAEAPQLVQRTVETALALTQKKAAAELVSAGILKLMKETWRSKLAAMGTALLVALLLLLIAGSAVATVANVLGPRSDGAACNH